MQIKFRQAAAVSALAGVLALGGAAVASAQDDGSGTDTTIDGSTPTDDPATTDDSTTNDDPATTDDSTQRGDADAKEGCDDGGPGGGSPSDGGSESGVTDSGSTP